MKSCLGCSIFEYPATLRSYAQCTKGFWCSPMNEGPDKTIADLIFVADVAKVCPAFVYRANSYPHKFSEKHREKL